MSIYRDKARGLSSILICSGLDPSGGAGFIADTRVATALGVRPVGVITAHTVQNTLGVQRVEPVEAEIVGAQVSTLLGDIEVQAVKLGIVGSPEIARELAHALDLTAAPLVWDPVAAPSRGRVIFDGDMFNDIIVQLGRHVRLLTPNMIELGLMVGRDIVDERQAVEAARVVIRRIGEVAVLVKSAISDEERVVDKLVTATTTTDFTGVRIGTEDIHGTGCALSTAIASHLALGASLEEACAAAKDFVAGHMRAAVRPGRGAPAVV